MSEKKQGQQRPGSAEDGSNNRLLQSMPRETVYGVRRRYPGTIEWELLKYFNPNKEEEEKRRGASVDHLLLNSSLG